MAKFNILLFLLINICHLNSQKDVYLKINQKLDDDLFQFEKLTKNNKNQSYFIKRIDYYLSDIALHHDNGIITKAQNVYVLVNKNQEVNVLLGKYFIENLDSITFNIGIDYETNHADPAQYPSNHPLAPKDPDMHWGWAAGYKFVVIEGQNGPDMIYEFQIHAFGDHLLTKVAVPVKGKSTSEKLSIELDANYQNAMNNMDLNKIVIVHGSNKDVIQLMKNFQTTIFKETSVLSGTDNYALNKIKIYPNPVSNGTFSIALDPTQVNNCTLVIKDIMGRVIQKMENVSGGDTIMIDHPGLYVAELIQNDKIISVGKIICL